MTIVKVADQAVPLGAIRGERLFSTGDMSNFSLDQSRKTYVECGPEKIRTYFVLV